jgi:N-hydroxyarylamine O-acetyltransferase
MEGQMTLAEITDEYLRALGLGRRHPDLAFLTDITSRHVANFSFSSVGPMLGDDLPLDIEALYQRIVVKRRGGYCFEQNGLMQAVLGELGFAVTLYLGRVIYNQDTHPGLTHRITLVETGGKQYVADVGFGPMGPRYPISLSGEETRENFRVFRIAEGRPGEFHMQNLKDGAFYSLYRFELHRYGQSDCEVGHFYSHKYPGATFVNHLVVSRILAEEIRSLRNREFWLISARGEQKHAIADGAQLQQELQNRFGISVDADEAHRLFERCAGPTQVTRAVARSA